MTEKQDIRLTVKVDNAGDITFANPVSVEAFGEIARDVNRGSVAFEATDGFFYIIPTARIWRLVGRHLSTAELAAGEAAAAVAREIEGH